MDEIIQQSQNTLIQIIIANTTSAMKISNTLCEHSEDNIMKPDDIICGLIYRLMIPMTDEEITESMNTAEDIMYDGSTSEEDDDLEVVDDTEDLKIQRKIQANNCNCDICSQVRVCLCNFNEYIPKDELGDKFKKSILDTCKSYNKII